MDADQYGKITEELGQIIMKELNITSRAQRRKYKIRKIINSKKHIH
jgi:hypothetical protein